MATMASCPAFATTAALVAANLSSEEKEQFKALWKCHLKLRDSGKIVYLLPRGMGTQLGAFHLREMATRLSILLETPVYIHFDVEKSSYRVGQLFDDLDYKAVSGCIFVFKAEYPPTCNGNSTASNLAPISQPLERCLDVELSATASIENLSSSKKKFRKIPKPRNMWIIYRQDKHNYVLTQNPGMHTSRLSTIISEMWHNESAEGKAHYKKLADQEKSEHQLQYPEYKCSPRKSSEIKKRKRPTKETLVSIEADLPAAKCPRLSENISPGVQQQSQISCRDDRIRGSGLDLDSDTTTLKSWGDDRQSSPRTLSPCIDWQSFDLFKGMDHGAFEQPPNDLFLDAEVLQPVDWEANDAELDWLL